MKVLIGIELLFSRNFWIQTFITISTIVTTHSLKPSHHTLILLPVAHLPTHIIRPVLSTLPSCLHMQCLSNLTNAYSLTFPFPARMESGRDPSLLMELTEFMAHFL